MTNKEMRAFQEWHDSQIDWHKDRLLRTGSKWHFRQWRWHRKRLRCLPMSFIVGEVLRKRAPEMAANVTKNNALLSMLKLRVNPNTTSVGQS